MAFAEREEEKQQVGVLNSMRSGVGVCTAEHVCMYTCLCNCYIWQTASTEAEKITNMWALSGYEHDGATSLVMADGDDQ